MRAIVFDHFGTPDVLNLVELPEPRCTAETATVLIKAASINPSDVKNVEGRMARRSGPAFPVAIIRAW
jgi:NADPH:quinone reductase-like Zn-dependent oxidoreductase